MVPSLTETLVEWRVDVVGRTRFCLHGSAPALGGTKDPDVEAIVALRPDLVVTNREENRAEDVGALETRGLNVILTDIRSLDDAAREMRRLGQAVGRVPEATALAQRIERVGREPPGLPAVCYIWRRPWMAVGPDTYCDDVLAAAGFRNVISEARYPEVTLEESHARGAVVALLPSEPYPFTRRQVPEVEEQFGPGSAILIDGQALSWYGPRTPAAVEDLRRLRRALGDRGVSR
jgi:ABC-type hemin transport system substrate-binding protein